MAVTDLGLITSIGNVVVLGRRGEEFDQIIDGAVDLRTKEVFDQRALLAIGKPYLRDATHALIMQVDEAGQYTNHAILAGIKRMTEQQFYDHWSPVDIETHGLKNVGIKKAPMARSEGLRTITQKLDSASLAELVKGANVFLFLGDKAYEDADAIEIVPTPGATVPEGFDLNMPVRELTYVNAFQPFGYHPLSEWKDNGAFLVGITKRAERHDVTGLVSAVMNQFGVGKYAKA